ncbi:MAG TPA: hypothetical protein VN690_09675 [Terriglobales bacterium]|nr:hypothetical protein [Terriglobales bacterium]
MISRRAWFVFLLVGLCGAWGCAAQEVWSSAYASYDAQNAVMYMGAACDADYYAVTMYDLTCNLSFSDTQNTFDYSQADAYPDWSASPNPNQGMDGAALPGDVFSAYADVSGNIDLAWEQCTEPPPPECGDGCVNPDPWSGCPPGELSPFSLEADDSNSAELICPQDGATPGEFTQLAVEYFNPSKFNITTPPYWKPSGDCHEITQINPTPYPNGWAFSPTGDFTDIGVFSPTMQRGLSYINTTEVPSTVLNGMPALPPDEVMPISPTTGVIYRTPSFQWDVAKHNYWGMHPYGLALDMGISPGIWETVAAWVEWSNGSGPAHILGNVCVEPKAEAAGHVHVDWRPVIGLACPTIDRSNQSWVVDYITYDQIHEGNAWPAR